MSKIFLPLFLMAVSIASCKKAAELKYNSPDNIYFDFDAATKDRDSIVYTFAYEPGKATDTILLPVRISGKRVNSARTFKVQPITQGTTAVPGVHYEALKESYTMPADSGTFALPIVLYNKDAKLSNESVMLRLSLVETSDFGLALTGLSSAKIVFSSKLEKPDWWEMWLGAYYSQVKHELFLISSGTIHMTLSGLDAPKNLYHVGRLNSFLADPFKWVGENSSKGYVLEQKNNTTYELYNSSNAAKKFVLRLNAQSGKYYFIDENGTEVI
ncbi:DUF4843 domain-containing protein [Pseudocnuella soli]|uniref:DUF4843 domain-containing protein n=1 Tax=Pseudocnuella soli TaxID=2502779 RepID=UPI0014045FEC|nr:DUF4843 domain-containing protein [Pseudocnuella soli]